MKLFLVFALTICAYSQETATPAKPADAAETHAKAVQLVEMSGGRERIVATLPTLIEQGTSAMRKMCPDCNPEFFTEWGKRMAARITPDDFLNIAVRAYENHLNNEELTEFLAVASAEKAGKPIPASAALLAKLREVMPAMMGEISGGSAEIGARLGMQIGAEIEKEHPEYFPAKPKPQP